jgi:acyl-CoA thioesterase
MTWGEDSTEWLRFPVAYLKAPVALRPELPRKDTAAPVNEAHLDYKTRNSGEDNNKVDISECFLFLFSDFRSLKSSIHNSWREVKGLSKAVAGL